MTCDSCEVAIIGGGPAGLAAAAAMQACGLDVWLIDEQPRLGGQIYRQPPAGFRVDSWLSGRIYRRGKALLERVERLADLTRVAPATVWGLFPAESIPGGGHRILYERDGKMGRLEAAHVLLATGCYEMPIPFPGWHLPGVMSAGGIQTLLKSQRVAAGSKVILAGSHPLLLVAADQLVGAGVHVAAVVLSQSLAAVARALRSPRSLLGGFGQLRHAASCLSRLRRARVPLLLGHIVTEALGADAVEAVRIRRSDLRGGSREVPCDALGICYGFLASSELARQAGARSQWQSGSGWVVAADEFMRSSVRGVSVAGELIGVAGAEAAAISGEIAGLGIAVDCRRLDPDAALSRARVLHRRLGKIRLFARHLATLSSPAPQLLQRLATPATLLCRCEDITVGDLAAALQREPGIASASSAKLLTRVGMGACQGRMCETAVRRLIAGSRDSALSLIAGYVPRVPVKPVRLEAIAAQAGEAGSMPGDPGAHVA